MSALKGPVTFTRFRVARAPDRGVVQHLVARAFAPLRPVEEPEDQTAGWVEVEDHDATLFESCRYGDWLLATWRRDTIRVPPAFLQKEVDNWKKSRTGDRPPTRAELREAKETIRTRLRLRAFPSTRTVDVAVRDTGPAHALVFTTTEGTVDEIASEVEALGYVLEPYGPAQLLKVAVAAGRVPQPPTDFDHAPLGRELLAWLLWRTGAGDVITQVPNVTSTPTSVSAECVDRIQLRGRADGTTGVTVIGGSGVGDAPVSRLALARGLGVATATFALYESDTGGSGPDHAKHTYVVTLDSLLTIRKAVLPAELSEAEDDRAAERLWLIERLLIVVDALFEAFLAARLAPDWATCALPAMRAWSTDPVSASP